MFCTNCGNQNDDAARFCAGCGAAATSGQASSSAPREGSLLRKVAPDMVAPPAAAPAAPAASATTTEPGAARPLSVGLAVGIFVAPFVFFWFTLREGYSRTVRVVSLAWLVGFLAIYASRPDPMPLPSTPSPAAAARPAPEPEPEREPEPTGFETFRTKDGYIASLTEAGLDKAIEFAASGDDQAFKAFIRGSGGAVFPLKPGLEVYVSDYVGLGTVKIRPKGQTVEIWTVREAIR